MLGCRRAGAEAGRARCGLASKSRTPARAQRCCTTSKERSLVTGERTTRYPESSSRSVHSEYRKSPVSKSVNATTVPCVGGGDRAGQEGELGVEARASAPRTESVLRRRRVGEKPSSSGPSVTAKVETKLALENRRRLGETHAVGGGGVHGRALSHIN